MYNADGPIKPMRHLLKDDAEKSSDPFCADYFLKRYSFQARSRSGTVDTNITITTKDKVCYVVAEFMQIRARVHPMWIGEVEEQGLPGDRMQAGAKPVFVRRGSRGSQMTRKRALEGGECIGGQERGNRRKVRAGETKATFVKILLGISMNCGNPKSRVKNGVGNRLGSNTFKAHSVPGSTGMHLDLMFSSTLERSNSNPKTMYMREELTVCNRKERSPWPVDGVKKELGWDQKVTYRIAGQPPGETLYILSCPVEADLETAEASTLFEAGTT
ncbi:hypothetical protein B0H16DRAFT_1478061 [Mycena metata]|uniref:Uncharacterized protein n=1 Tax=Mycena metata TaxID=1033252 RepID=A0AAD7H7K5_9AGAR|nr:hypothetical protein B0H16DRAFT_1478061 [Mycena metata]